MSNATAVAPERATKASARAKAAPSTTPVETQAATAPDTSSCTEDERLVINTLREQLQQIYDLHWGQIYLYSNELLQAGVEALENVDDSSAALHRAAALTYGALTMQKVERPGSAEIAVIEAVFTSLNSAAISYGFSEEGCVALANGIRAGQRQFRDRPSPPIRRVEGDSEDMGRSALTRKQLLCVLEVAASNLATIDNILKLAQDEPASFALSGLVDAAQALTRHCGGMVDTAAGAGILGGHDRWNFGPNFADLGKAGEA